VRLLDRSRRGVEPTPYGRALIKRGIAIFDEMRQGIEEIEFLSDPTAGEVRIGATDPINGAIVAPVIDRLSRRYPRVGASLVPSLNRPTSNLTGVAFMFTRLGKRISRARVEW
jgi:DNA-binding transcriptional LysR family regulator